MQTAGLGHESLVFSALEVGTSLDEGNSVVFLGKTQCLSLHMCIMNGYQRI